VNRLAIAAAAGTGVQVGAGMVATRFVVDQIDPASLGMLRYIIGFLCLLPPLLLTRQRLRVERQDVAPIALLGILQFGVLIGLLNFGLQFIPAARAALIFATFPLMTLVIAAAMGRERLGLAKTAGVLLTILGVGVVLGEKALTRGAADAAWLGEAAVLACTFCGALCSVLYRPYLRKYPTLPVSAFAMLASIFFLASLAAGEGFFTTPLRLTAAGWGAVLFIGFISGGGYFLWLYALTHGSPTRVSAFLALSPITAALLGGLLLGEPMTAGTLTGLALVVLGLWVAHLQTAEARTT
jgi:drug/metabolite transporter (DMT)-like permease